jgi:hypothetical protein
MHSKATASIGGRVAGPLGHEIQARRDDVFRAQGRA